MKRLAITPPRSTYNLYTRRYLGALRRTGAIVPSWFADAIDVFVEDLVSASLFTPAKIPALWIHRNISEPCVRINLMAPGYASLDAPYGVVPTFTQYVGSTGALTAGYRSLVIISSFAGISLNSAGSFVQTGVAGTTINALVGIVSGSSAQRTMAIVPRDASGKVGGRANAVTLSTTTASVADRTGFRAAIRRDSANQIIYGNAGAFMQTFAIASTALSPQGLSLFVTGTTATFADDLVQYWGLVGGLVDVEVTALAAALAALNAAIDARP